MKIAVVGASGRSGREFVRAALTAGHTVTAGTLHAQVAIAATNQLTTKMCDATDPDEVRPLIEGHDAVVSLLGHVHGSAPDVQTRAIETVIQTMGECGVKRLVSLTGTGVRFPQDRVTVADKLLTLALWLADRHRLRDGIQHAERIKQSDLDWTIVRVMKLQDTPAKPFMLTEHGPAKIIVSRSEVAQAILDVLEHGTYIHQAPIISPRPDR